MGRKQLPLPQYRYPAGSWLCAIFLGYFATVHLLIFVEGGYVTIAGAKYRSFLYSSLIFVAAVLLLFLELRFVKSPAKKQGRGREWETLIFPAAALLYLGFTVLSGIASPYSGTFWGNSRYEGTVTIGLYVVSALILSKHLIPQKWMLGIFGLSVSLLCLIGIVQLTGANPFALYPDGYTFYDAGTYYAGQYWSTIGNVNLCAALLSLASGSFMAAFIRGQGPRAWLCMIPLFLSVFSIFSLNSEAGIVSALLGSLLIAPFLVTNMESAGRLLCAYGGMILAAALSRIISFSADGAAFSVTGTALALVLISGLLLAAGYVLTKITAVQRFRPKRIRCCVILMVCTALIAALIFLYAYDAFPNGFLQQAHELLHGNWDDSYGSGRLFIWRQVWDKIQERPFLGGGPDTLGMRGLTGWSRYNDTLEITVSSTIDAAHNEYLNIWVNQGLLALVSYLAVLVWSMIRWWKHPDNKTASVAGGAVLFYAIQAFFGISMCITAPYLWIALAVLNNKNIYEGEKEHEVSKKTTRT